jgi:hypothetical protein
MPGESGRNRGDYARVVLFLSHARLRVRLAPGIPHALTFRGEGSYVQLGRYPRRGIVKTYLKLHAVIARSGATKQSILPLRGAMDCFASLAMTDMSWLFEN